MIFFKLIRYKLLSFMYSQLRFCFSVVLTLRTPEAEGEKTAIKGSELVLKADSVFPLHGFKQITALFHEGFLSSLPASKMLSH